MRLGRLVGLAALALLALAASVRTQSVDFGPQVAGSPSPVAWDESDGDYFADLTFRSREGAPQLRTSALGAPSVVEGKRALLQDGQTQPPVYPPPPGTPPPPEGQSPPPSPPSTPAPELEAPLPPPVVPTDPPLPAPSPPPASPPPPSPPPLVPDLGGPRVSADLSLTFSMAEVPSVPTRRALAGSVGETGSKQPSGTDVDAGTKPVALGLPAEGEAADDSKERDQHLENVQYRRMYAQRLTHEQLPLNSDSQSKGSAGITVVLPGGREVEVAPGELLAPAAAGDSSSGKRETVQHKQQQQQLRRSLQQSDDASPPAPSPSPRRPVPRILQRSSVATWLSDFAIVASQQLQLFLDPQNNLGVEVSVLAQQQVNQQPGPGLDAVLTTRAMYYQASTSVVQPRINTFLNNPQAAFSDEFLAAYNIRSIVVAAGVSGTPPGSNSLPESATPSPSPTPGGGSGGSSSSGVVAVAVAVPVVVVAVFALGAFALVRWRRSRHIKLQGGGGTGSDDGAGRTGRNNRRFFEPLNKNARSGGSGSSAGSGGRPVVSATAVGGGGAATGAAAGAGAGISVAGGGSMEEGIAQPPAVAKRPWFMSRLLRSRRSSGGGASSSDAAAGGAGPSAAAGAAAGASGSASTDSALNETYGMAPLYMARPTGTSGVVHSIEAYLPRQQQQTQEQQMQEQQQPQEQQAAPRVVIPPRALSAAALRAAGSGATGNLTAAAAVAGGVAVPVMASGRPAMPSIEEEVRRGGHSSAAVAAGINVSSTSSVGSVASRTSAVSVASSRAAAGMAGHRAGGGAGRGGMPGLPPAGPSAVGPIGIVKAAKMSYSSPSMVVKVDVDVDAFAHVPTQTQLQVDDALMAKAPPAVAVRPPQHGAGASTSYASGQQAQGQPLSGWRGGAAGGGAPSASAAALAPGSASRSSAAASAAGAGSGLLAQGGGAGRPVGAVAEARVAEGSYLGKFKGAR